MAPAWPQVSAPEARPQAGDDRSSSIGGTLIVTPDRPVLPRDLAGTVAWAGVDPTLSGRELQDALRRAIASRRGSCDWTVDHAGWVVMLLSPEEQTFYGKSLAVRWPGVWSG
jgi:hypothetical protein